MGISFFKSLLKVTSQEPEWRWTRADPGHLHIIAQEQSYNVAYAYLVDNRIEEVPPSDRVYMRDLTVAYAKQALGRVRGKYGNATSGPGEGKTLDADKLLDESEKSLEALRQSLMRKVPPIPPRRH